MKKVMLSPYQTVEFYRVVRCWELQYGLGNRLTYGAEFVSFTRQPRSAPQKYLLLFWYSFLLEAE
jgi:hypothetical protein